MTFPPGSRIGRYEVRARIGAGGMGEVYRAWDSRLGREVAVKVLAATSLPGAELLLRFEQEVRAIGLLAHPNVLVAHDSGTHDGVPYLVAELLEGEDLRQLLRQGPLPPRDVIAIGAQVARGLAAAHAKGIAHRDLKPENLFLTRSNVVKILDFGLAKLTRNEASDPEGEAPTSPRTEPGAILGTVGYMSPEQVRGRAAGGRSDLFSLGTVLHEMLTGRPPFRRGSAIETMNAILKEEAGDLAAECPDVPPGLERIVRRCLEKDLGRRYQSARDLAFALEGVGDARASGLRRSVRASMPARPLSAAVLLSFLVLLVGWGGLAAVLGLKERRSAPLTIAAGRRLALPPLSFRRLTFRHGVVSLARFTVDGGTVVYGAQWDGRPVEVFLTRTANPAERPVGLPGFYVTAVSPRDEMIVCRPFGGVFRVPLQGGAPRAIAEHGGMADWGPDGSLLRSRPDAAGSVIEYPQGRDVFHTPGVVLAARVAPSGDRIAIMESLDGAGTLWLVEAGRRRKLGVFAAGSIAWFPEGREIGLTVDPPTGGSALLAVDLRGNVRTLLVSPTASMVLHDISRDGRILLELQAGRYGVLYRAPGSSEERELGWLDRPSVSDLSDDGRTMILNVSGEAGGPERAVYQRDTDGSPPVHLGPGRAMDLSPDGKWVLTWGESAGQFRALPTGPGVPRTYPLGRLLSSPLMASFKDWASFFPDSRRIVFRAREPGGAWGAYVQEPDGGEPRSTGLALSSRGGISLSPDGSILGVMTDGGIALVPLKGGRPRSVPAVLGSETLAGWSHGGRYLYVWAVNTVPTRVDRIDLATLRRERWKDLAPADPAGVQDVSGVAIARDGKSYAYTYRRLVYDDLYLVEGLR